MKKPGIIFDFDGVLVCSEPHWLKVSSEYLRGLIPNWSQSDQQQILGKSARDVYTLLVSAYSLEMSWEEYVQSYQSLARDIYGNLAQPVPGAFELVSFLEQSGYLLGIASSAPREWIDIALKRFHIAQRFRVVLGAEDVEGRIKPAPDVYLLAASRLSLSPSDCVAIDDSEKGVKSAHSAGMPVIGLALDKKKVSELAGSDRLLGSFEEVPIRDFTNWIRISPKPSAK